MNQQIIAFAGKKQSGKNTSYSCIRLWRPEAQDFSFADSLKRVCIDVLGLEEWQAYGTDEQKNTTCPHLLWENFPVPAYTRDNGSVFVGRPDGIRFPMNQLCNQVGSLQVPVSDGVKWVESLPPIYSATVSLPLTVEYNPDEAWDNGVRLLKRRGPMTAREVLQFWGTEIFRKQYPEVWADACIRKITKSGCGLAVITDCRFPNEVAAVQRAGGKVIRLTRVVFPNDRHPSETALDPECYDQGKFDAILDNAEMSIDEQCESLYALLRPWGIVESKKVHRMHV